MTDNRLGEVSRRDVTVLMGGHTRAAVTTAEVLRDTADELCLAGVFASRQWSARRRLVPALDMPTPKAGTDILDEISGGRPGRFFMSHLNGLGDLSRAVGEGVLYPDAEAGVAGVARLFADERLRLAIGIAPLTRFFTTAKGPMAKAVRKSQWHKLYDLSWADRIELICDLVPDADVLVLTDQGTALDSAGMAARLFGVQVGDPSAYLTPMLDAAGQARLTADATLSAVTLLAENGLRADPETLAARGIDEALARLLDDRFDDDLRRLKDLEKVQVI